MWRYLHFIVNLKIMFRGCVLLFVGMVTALVNVPNIVINNGRSMPTIALGTFLAGGQDGLTEPMKNQLRDAVLNAIDIGYRHIDTAYIYNTEEQIGEAVEAKIREGVVTREDMFITTKLWNCHHRKEQVLLELRESLTRLRTNYVDLYLMHWPMGLNDDYSFSLVDYMETWRGMEDALALELVRAIGVSNFNRGQLLRVLREGSVPAVVQTEIHPTLIETDLTELCKLHNITVMGYSPLGSLIPRYGVNFPGPKLDDPLLAAIGEKYNKTTAQVVLRWAVDRNIVPIPKSVNPKRLQENIDLFDFSLTHEEIQQINGFNTNSRLIIPSFWQEHKYWPFEKVENPMPNPFLKKNLV